METYVKLFNDKLKKGFTWPPLLKDVPNSTYTIL